jgi:glycosyltransferase involved in cell wall biosynthesis
MPEGEGTVLDNSCVMWISNMWSGSQHDSTKVPVLLAGGLGCLVLFYGVMVDAWLAEYREALPLMVLFYFALGEDAEAAARAGLELRVVGARGWGGVSPNGVRWLGEVADAELVQLLRGARALVYPSLYEGFGIPILEAMSVGTPVVTSRGGSTEEVAGGAAVLVDPGDVSSIAAGIEEADRRRHELRTLGLERARSFSWEDVARRTVQVYRDALA